MFNAQEKTHILTSLQLAIASAKRARNGSRSAKLAEVYDQMLTELNQLQEKIRTLKTTA